MGLGRSVSFHTTYRSWVEQDLCKDYDDVIFDRIVGENKRCRKADYEKSDTRSFEAMTTNA